MHMDLHNYVYKLYTRVCKMYEICIQVNTLTYTNMHYMKLCLYLQTTTTKKGVHATMHEPTWLCNAYKQAS